MNYSKLQSEILKTYTFGNKNIVQSEKIAINYYQFTSDEINNKSRKTEHNAILSDDINENKYFFYPVISPKSQKKHSKAIILLHGLNERNWHKYMCWAISLTINLDRPVIMFPMAYHINRSPQSWSNPRILDEIYKIRKKEHGNDRSISFANIALSNRLSDQPDRFFNSGKQSLTDINKLITDIKSGKHDLFTEDTETNILAYSIGAFLAEITLMSDSKNLFTNSKLFMFCGGGTFNSMSGESRQIMDKFSFDAICNFYRNEFALENRDFQDDQIKKAFLSLISDKNFTSFRKQFFENNAHRIKGIFLEQDRVMPYFGVELAMEKEVANKRIKLLDFDFEYTHENPFPIFESTKHELVNSSFQKVFEIASEHLY